MSEQEKNLEAAIPEDEAIRINYVALASEEQGHKVVLKETPDSRGMVEMFVGGSEFAAIAKELGLIQPPRPLTHDIYMEILDGLGVEFKKLEIHSLEDNAYLARLHYVKQGREAILDVRPSDGIAIALKNEVPIVLNKRLLKGTLSAKDRGEALAELVKTVEF